MDVRKNLNNEYTEKKLNLPTKIHVAVLYKNLYQIQSKINLNFEPGHLNFTKLQNRSLNDSDKI